MSSLNHHLDISKINLDNIKQQLRIAFNLSEDVSINFDKFISFMTNTVNITITGKNENDKYLIEKYNLIDIKYDFKFKICFENIIFKHEKNKLLPFIAVFSNLCFKNYKPKTDNLYKNYINVLAGLHFYNCEFYISESDIFRNITFHETLKFEKCFFSKVLLFDMCIFYKNFYLETTQSTIGKVEFKNILFSDKGKIILNNQENELKFLNVEFHKPFDCFACNLHNIKQVSFIDVLFKDYCHLSELEERDTYPSELPIYKQKEINYKSKVVFRHTIFEKPLNFQNVNFENGFEFAEVNCYKKVIFSNGVSSLNKNGEREIFLQNSVFKDEVDFSEVSFENKILHIDKTTFEKSFSLTMVDYNKLKTNEFGKGLVINNSTFKGNVNLSNCCFNCKVIIFNCAFKRYIQIHRSYFQDKVQFEKNIVNKIISFDKSEFKEEVIFDYTIFNDILSLLFVLFHKAPKFALVKFVNSANIQTFNLRIGESNEELNEDCYKKENIENKLHELKARIDTFRLIKDQAIKNNDLLVATEQKKLELYARELELDYYKKINGVEYLSSVYQKTTPESVKITTIEVFDRLFLKLNRTTSDHHTDFLKILLFTLSVIGGYFMMNLNLGLSSDIYEIKNFNILFFISAVVVLIVSLFLMYKKIIKFDMWFILTFLFIGAISYFFIGFYYEWLLSLGLPIMFIGILVILLKVFSEKLKISYMLFAIFGVVGIVSSPSIITPFLGAFSEDARNHYLYKAIDELDDKKALKLARIILPNDKDLKKFEPSKTILSKNAKLEQISIFDKTDLSVNFIYEQSNQDKNEQSIYKAKKTLKDYKDELKSSKLLDESPELKRAVAIDGGVSRLNIAYYLVLAFCIFALQKTMRKNSIIPS